MAIDLEGFPGEEEWQQGLLVLKGGDLSGEIEVLRDFDPEVNLERVSLKSLLGRNEFFEEGDRGGS